MERLKYLFLGLLALSLVGCGQTVIETLNVPENPGPNAPGAGKTIVILPFADYSQGGNITSAHRRNLMVTETLTDRLSATGFSMPVQEDVVQYLIAKDIIDLVPYETGNSSSLVNELDNDWSDTMKSILKSYIGQQGAVGQTGPVASPGTHGLTPRTIAQIGRNFNADYVVRGRILEFKTREDTSWEPWKRGILPFVNNGANRIMFGFADSSSYDQTNSQITGGAIGAVIGHSAGGPWDSGDDSILGIEGYKTANSIFWGGVGAVIGNQAYHSRTDQAAVQLRIWVQEASTGNVVWTNRISVKVSPESVLADNQYDGLFNSAIEKGVSTLIDNFVIYTFL